jgi:hypothetical protein
MQSRRQRLAEQRLHGTAAAGGHDHLAQASGLCGSQQLRHPGTQSQTTSGQQGCVVLLLAGLQGLHPAGIRVPPLQLAKRGPDALPATGNGQPGRVGVLVPVDRHTGLGKGPVEGQAMAIPLGFRQGPIHIPEQGRKRHRSATAPQEVAG